MKFFFQSTVSSFDAIRQVRADLLGLIVHLHELLVDEVFFELFLALDVEDQAGLLEGHLLEVREVFFHVFWGCERIHVSSAVAKSHEATDDHDAVGLDY